ncbi:MAG: DUF2520 domain-containing protein [Dysgonomonas sp.]|nr:DUF2520 domain-containing protein [Dysgonomonas sp.]
MNIVFIGAGRLATHLAKELYKNSYNILQVYSRTMESAYLLANEIDAVATNNIQDIPVNADLYIFSVKDSVLKELISLIPSNKGLWIHTAGSISMDIFEKYTNRYGVLYPFQTFSKERDLNFREIPVFIEANNEQDFQILKDLSISLSDKVYPLSSKKRQYIHLTGVFACNFVNHMYAISENILKEENIPFEALLPLIDETASKVHTLSPIEAQTGPAMRYDENVINKHLVLIENPRLKSIYTLISESIYETYNKK